MRGGAGCWIAVMGEFGKDSYQHVSPKPSHVGSEFRMDLYTY